ncbi:MAG: ABC transporter ATP-binding protein, partial [Lachnospiraceae bacterium]|nr:ABC transporter ATP-binding protein [Lachnospiraceae bacterium]
EILKIHYPEISKEERKKQVLKTMSQVGLRDCEMLYDMYPHELSGGMRQRIMIAAAMIGNPQILIADEPTTALDITTQAKIVKLLRKINEVRHTAILFISHDLSLVSQLCHRVIVMQKGRIVEEGSAAEIFEHPKDAYTKELIAAIPKVDLSEGEEA